MPRKPLSIVLIHGLWMTPHSWKPFVKYYEALGYRVAAPAWPRLKGSIEDLRREPSVLAGLGVLEIADHYDRFIRAMPEAPIVIGHSFGGLIAQILLDRGLGAAGVAIDATAPKGVFRLPFSQIKAASPVLSHPLSYNSTVMPTFDQFHYAFANTLSERDARNIYEQEVIPGPGRPLFQAALANFTPHAATTIDFRNSDRSPLLLINGSRDNLVPESVNRSTHRKYARSGAITEYKQFEARSHLIVAEPGWEEVAQFAVSWAEAKAVDVSLRVVRAA